MKYKDFDEARNQYNAALECPQLASAQRTTVGDRLKKVDKEVSREDREARQKAERDRYEAEQLALDLDFALAQTDSLLILSKINEKRATGNELGFKAQVELRDGDRTAAFRLAEFIEKYTDPGNAKATEALLAATYFNNDPRHRDRLGWRAHTLVEKNPNRAVVLNFSNDGERVGCVDEQGIARIWEVVSGKILFSHQINDVVSTAVFSPALDAMAVAGSFGRLTIFDAATGKPIFEKIFEKAGIEKVKFSSDGRRVAVQLANNAIEILDIRAGNEAPPILKIKPDSLRYATHFSDDLQHLAIVSCEEKVKIYSAATDAFVSPGEANGYLFAAAFSPDGKYFACSTEDRELLLFNSETGALLGKFTTKRDVAVAARTRDGAVRELEIPSTGAAFQIQFSADGNLLTAFFADLTALSFEVNEVSGLVFRNFFKTSFDGMFDAKASSNGQYLLFNEGSRLEILDKISNKISDKYAAKPSADGTKMVVSTAPANQCFINVFEGKYQPPYSFSSLGNRFAYGLTEGRVAVRDLKEGIDNLLFLNGAAQADRLVFSPDDQFLAIARIDGTVEIWDASGRGAALSPAAVVGQVVAAEFSPDGSAAAMLDEAGLLSLFDIEKEKLVFQKRASLPLRAALNLPGKPLLNLDATSLRLRFSPDGRQLMLCGRSNNPIQRDTIYVFKTADGSPDFEIFTAGFLRANFVGGGRFIQHESGVGMSALFLASTGKKVDFLPSNCRGLQVSADGKLAVFKNAENILAIETATGSTIFTLKPEALVEQYAQKQLPTGDNFFPLDLSPDGKKLLVNTDFGKAKIFNTANWQPLGDFNFNGNERPQFSPDSRRVVSLSYSYFSIWDAENGRLKAGLPAGGQRPVISKKGEWMAVVQEEQVVIYDFKLAEERMTLRGHRDNVEEMAFSNDEKRLATASVDKTIKCWNLATGREIFSISSGEAAVRSLEFSPDGQFLIANKGEQDVRIWTIAPRKLLAMVQLRNQIAPLGEDQIYRFNLEQAFLEKPMDSVLIEMEPSTQLGFARYFANQAGLSLDPQAYSELFDRSTKFYERGISNLDSPLALLELGEVLIKWSVKLRKDSLFRNSRQVASAAREVFDFFKTENEISVLLQKAYASALAARPDEATKYWLDALKSNLREADNIHAKVDFLASLGDDWEQWSGFWAGFQPKIPKEEERLDLGSGLFLDAPASHFFDDGDFEGAAKVALSDLASGLADLHSNPRPAQAGFVSERFADLSWYFLFTKRGTKTARRYAQAALTLDSTVLFSNINLGHAALFDGDFEGAAKIYESLRDIRSEAHEQYFEDLILKDLETIAKTGRRFWNRDVPRAAERLLGEERWDELQARRFSLRQEAKNVEPQQQVEQKLEEAPQKKKKSKKGKN